MELVGCGTALVTPFRADGTLDEGALRALVNWQIGESGEPGEVRGVDWLVSCGTTGETPTLSHAEWRNVLTITAEAAAGRVPVWAGCSSNSTREAVERAVEAANIPGITAILTANPYYNKPSQEGQFQHFKAVAEAVASFPVVLYNIPSRSGVNLLPQTIARLAETCPNIVGVKESSGNMAQITELITLVSRGFSVYAGDDALALGILGAGGAGLISVGSNVLPVEMATMVRAALSNDWATARRLMRTYMPLLLANFSEPSPGPVKAILAMMGMIHETYRLPMMPVAEETRKTLRDLAQKVGLLDHSQARA